MSGRIQSFTRRFAAAVRSFEAERNRPKQTDSTRNVMAGASTGSSASRSVDTGSDDSRPDIDAKGNGASIKWESHDSRI